MTMQSAPTGMQPVGDVTDEAMVALATTEMPGAILQASGMATDGEDQFTHDAVDTIDAVIVQTNHDADGGSDRPPTPADRATVSQELPEDSVQQAHAIPRPSVAPDYGQESVGAVEDDPRDAEQIQRPDVPDDEAEPPYGQRQGRPIDREMMKLAFERRAERDAERKQASDERLNAVLTKPTRRDSAPVTDVQSSCQPQITVGDEGSTLPADITSVIKPTAVGDDEGDGHETNDGATESPSAQVGTVAEDDVIPETATGNDDDKDEPADDEEQRVTHFNIKVLDESSGDLVALEDFDREVNDRAFQGDWFGAHNDISRQAIREELLRKGEYTAHVDDAGKLLSDPDEYRLADDVNARITVCVHRERSEDQKREFILRSQTGKRILTYEEQRALKNRLIVVQLRLGVDYKSIAKMARVHPNTVRNVENRAAADPNSKLGNTKRPDGRLSPENLQKVATARELRAAGMENSFIALVLDTDLETVGKLLKDPSSKAKKKNKHKPVAATKSPEDLAASDGVPEPHRSSLKHLNKDATAFTEWLKSTAEQARKESEATFGHMDSAAATADDLEKLNKSILNHIQRANLETARLRQIVSGGSEAKVQEAPPADSGSDVAGPTRVGDCLRGIVESNEAGEVSVTLPVFGGGVIDNPNDFLAMYGPPEAGQAVRVRVVGFDRKRGLWKLQPLGRQTAMPTAAAAAPGPSLDEGPTTDAEATVDEADVETTEVTK